MESYIDRDSPLATLLEGDGAREHDTDRIQPHMRPDERTASSHPHRSLRHLIRNRLACRPTVLAGATSSATTTPTTNRFLERFRYTLVASQLVDETQDLPAARLPQDLHVPAPKARHATATADHDTEFGLVGALIAACAALLTVIAIHRLLACQTHLGRLSMLCAFTTLIIPILHLSLGTYRQQYVTTRAVIAAQRLIAELRQFELSSNATFALIQEVELVSRGYRISSPLPPITRLEDTKAARRCISLRRQLRRTLLQEVGFLIDIIPILRPHVKLDDLDKYLDIYDLPHQACLDALNLEDAGDASEEDTIGHLRLLSYRRGLLRRYLLCSLLAIDADSDVVDLDRWRVVIHLMTQISAFISAHVKSLNSTLQDMSDFVTPSSPSPEAERAPARIRAQLHQLAALSQGIRSINARVVLMKEDSNKALQDSDDLSDLGPLLINQYESIGLDLHSLLQAWETGKVSLSADLQSRDRCTSLTSAPPGLLSPTDSLGGSTTVSEHDLYHIDSSIAEAGGSGGGPADALAALNGTGLDTKSDTSGTDYQEQVFEAIAMPPRKRASMYPPGTSRAERIARAHEDRRRQTEAREKRMSGATMIRELQSVINVRRASMPVETSAAAHRTSGQAMSTTDMKALRELDERENWPGSGPRPSPTPHADGHDALGVKKRRTSSLTVKPPFAGLGVRVG